MTRMRAKGLAVAVPAAAVVGYVAAVFFGGDIEKTLEALPAECVEDARPFRCAQDCPQVDGMRMCLEAVCENDKCVVRGVPGQGHVRVTVKAE